MKKNRIMALILLCAMAAATLAGCGNSNSKDTTAPAQTQTADNTTAGDETAASKNIFTYAIGGDPGNNVNVITTSDRFGLMTIKMVYSPLYMYNADGIEYFLAKDMEVSDDGLVYTANLRDDVLWSDGEKFTADDVVFTYNAMLDEKNAGWANSQLYFGGKPVKVEKVDDYTVTFTLPQVSSSAMEMLSIFIMPEHIYKDVTNFETNDVNVNPVGTGPYTAEEYKPGEYLKFKANPNYFKGKPSIENIVYRFIEDSNTAKLAIQTGEVDAWVALPTDLADFEGNSNLKTYTYEEGRVAYLWLNSTAENMKNKELRQAVFYSLNRNDMISAAYVSDEYASPVYSFLPNTNTVYQTSDLEKYGQDVDKAKELLSSSGVTNPTLKLVYTGSDDAQSKLALIIQAQCKAAGINVELNALDSAAISQSWNDKENGDYDMYLGGYIMGIDPDTFQIFFDTTTDNLFRYNNPEIDRLFAQGKVTLDETQRKDVYTKIQQLAADEALFYPILSNKRILVVNNAVEGIEEAKLVPVYTFEDTSYLKFK